MTICDLEFTVACNDRRQIWRRWTCGVNFCFGRWWNYIFFWNWDFRVLLMMLLSNFFYLLSMRPFFLEMVPLVSILLGSASASFFWDCSGWFMLYSKEASSWWSSDTSACDGSCVVLKFSGDLVKVDQWCYLCVLFLFQDFRHEFYYFHMTLYLVPHICF